MSQRRASGLGEQEPQVQRLKPERSAMPAAKLDGQEILLITGIL